MPRVIFALEIELIPPPGKGSVALIAWLNRNGQSQYCRAYPGNGSYDRDLRHWFVPV